MNFKFFSKGFMTLLFSAGLLLTGCYDDSYLRDQLVAYGDRLNKLEEIAEDQNKQLTDLKTIVDAINANDFVTGVKEIKENGKVVGYTITFSKSGEVKILNGKDGAAGKDGQTPAIGVKKDNDGKYYWTLNGEWLLDSGNKVPASGNDGATGQDGAAGKDGITPKLKIEQDQWYISYNNGLTWEPEPLGPAIGTPGQNGDSMFSSVTYDNDFVYLTLAKDNTVLKLPRKEVGQSSSTANVSVTIGEVNATDVVFNGTINAPAEELDYIQVIIRYSPAEQFSAMDESLPCIVLNKKDFGAGKDFTVNIKDLSTNVEYKYCVIIRNRGNEEFGKVLSFTPKQIIVAPTFSNGSFWVHGISNIPDSAGWPTQDSDKLLKWDASYGWFDVNKVDPDNTDSKLCWAATASNMIHWWLKVNEANIQKYNKYTGPQGYTSSSNEEVYKYFRKAFFNNGNPTHYGVEWFLTGRNDFGKNYFLGPNNGDIVHDCGFMKEVLGDKAHVCEYTQQSSAAVLTEKIKDALTNNKCIALVHNLAGVPHAINMWGAEFDSNGVMTHIYITDNNDKYLDSRAGLLKRGVKDVNGNLMMTNWAGTYNILVQAITLMGSSSDEWATYFATHP